MSAKQNYTDEHSISHNFQKKMKEINRDRVNYQKKHSPDTKTKITPLKMPQKALKNRITNNPIATIWKMVVHRASVF